MFVSHFVSKENKIDDYEYDMIKEFI